MKRVVITGLGVVSPIGNDLESFARNLRDGVSGIKFQPELAELGFACQVGGRPDEAEVQKKSEELFSTEQRVAMNSSMNYAGVAGLACMKDAGLAVNEETDWACGAVVGTGIGGLDTIGHKIVARVNERRIKRLGSTVVEQTMVSSVSAFLAGHLGLGGPVSTNSSACNTGTEAIINGYNYLKNHDLERMLVGGVEGYSPYCWAGFDGMKVLTRAFNEQPSIASRPMSASSKGFVPACGTGLLMLETLDSAQKRGARIYAEVLGGALNCGGQRNGGSITFPNPLGVQRCIKQALSVSGVDPSEVDAINGHLTGTKADASELKNWSQALARRGDDFPFINASKSMFGHALGAAGGLECVGAVLQLKRGFLHPSLNCEDLLPELDEFAGRIVRQELSVDLDLMVKASFGFGDVNGCVVFRKYLG